MFVLAPSSNLNENYKEKGKKTTINEKSLIGLSEKSGNVLCIDC